MRHSGGCRPSTQPSVVSGPSGGTWVRCSCGALAEPPSTFHDLKPSEERKPRGSLDSSPSPVVSPQCLEELQRVELVDGDDPDTWKAHVECLDVVLKVKRLKASVCKC